MNIDNEISKIINAAIAVGRAEKLIEILDKENEEIVNNRRLKDGGFLATK